MLSLECEQGRLRKRLKFSKKCAIPGKTCIFWTRALILQARCQLSDGGGGDQYPFFNYLTKNRNVRQTQHDQSVRKGGFDRTPPPVATGHCRVHNAPNGGGVHVPGLVDTRVGVESARGEDSF